MNPLNNIKTFLIDLRKVFLRKKYKLFKFDVDSTLISDEITIYDNLCSFHNSFHVLDRSLSRPMFKYKTRLDLEGMHETNQIFYIMMEKDENGNTKLLQLKK